MSVTLLFYFQTRYQSFCCVCVYQSALCVFVPEVKVSGNGPERRSGKIIIAGTAFRLEFLVGWCYDADTTMAVRELY